jgi:hypothetical protein
VVLKPAACRLRRPRGAQAGITLIELVMALSLSALVAALSLALYRDVGRAARLAGTHKAEDVRARALFGALSENLLAGGGLLHLGPGRVLLLNVAGRRLEYAWEDSTLTVNGKPWPLRLASLRLEPAGPSMPPGEEESRARMEFAAVDSLDDDRDGNIDADELDVDGSGELEARECRYVARVALRLVTIADGTTDSLSAVVHPRNRAPGDGGNRPDALDALPGVGDFGR